MNVFTEIRDLTLAYIDAGMTPAILYIDRDTFNELDKIGIGTGVYRNVDGNRAYGNMRIIVVEDFHWIGIGVAL